MLIVLSHSSVVLTMSLFFVMLIVLSHRMNSVVLYCMLLRHKPKKKTSNVIVAKSEVTNKHEIKKY